MIKKDKDAQITRRITEAQEKSRIAKEEGYPNISKDMDKCATDLNKARKDVKDAEKKK